MVQEPRLLSWPVVTNGALPPPASRHLRLEPQRPRGYVELGLADRTWFGPGLMTPVISRSRQSSNRRMRRLEASLVPQYPLQEPLAGWPTWARPPRRGRGGQQAEKTRSSHEYLKLQCAIENPNGEYSTASTPQPDDITAGLRGLLGCRGDDGTAGTDSAVARVPRAVLTSSSITERRRAHGGRPGVGQRARVERTRNMGPFDP